jgi:hypothetical protein
VVAEVAEVPDGVLRPHSRVPPRDQRLVVLLDGSERAGGCILGERMAR